MQAQAFVVETYGDGGTIRDVDVADPGPGEARVRMAASGVCSTDAHAANGTSQPPVMPVVLGHEGAGIVDAVGPNSGLEPGDHVIFGRFAPCGRCEMCRRGLATDCDGPEHRNRLLGIMEDGTTRLSVNGTPAYPLYGGTLAEYTTVRADHLVRIDRDLPLDLMCLVGCAVVTGFGAVFNVAKVGVGDSVVVAGCGGIGTNIVQAARIAGATTIIAVDRFSDKLDQARQSGATHTILAPQSIQDAVHSVVSDGVDVAFEAVGSPELVASCVECTRVGGLTVMVGIPALGSALTLSPFSLLQGRRLVGCRGGSVLPQRDIATIVDLYRAGSLDLASQVGARLPLDEVHGALESLQVGDRRRSVILFPPARR